MSAQSHANTSVSPMSALEIQTLTGRQAELSILEELFSSGVGAVTNIGSVGASPSGSSDGILAVAGSLNGTEETAASQENCTNNMCIPDADYLEEIWDYIFPSPFEWIFIGLHVVVFFMGLIGNSLVVYAVMRGKNMRSVTNTFIVNLAVADFLLLLICQPSSLLVDATETWYLGNALCKFITYFQTVTVYVSVFTLSAISIDRYYAICHPLKFIHTIRRAVAVTCFIWFLSAVMASPEIFGMELKPTVPVHITNLLLTCSMSWDSSNRALYQILQMVCIYFIPMSLMTCAYSIIAVRLWHTDLPGRDDPVVRMLRSGVSASHPETQLLSRRRVAKMLIAMVIIFAVCYLPVYVLNIMRQCGTLKTINAEWIPVFAMAARWLCYFNSAINPVIYNFMSAKFRKEFRFIVSRCCRKNAGRRSYVQSFSRHSYKLPSTFRRTDHLTLSSLSTRQVQPTTGCRTPMHAQTKMTSANT